MVHYVKLEYANGKSHNGFISKLNSNYFPPIMVFTDREVAIGEVGEHIIDFNNLRKMVIKLRNENEEQVYKADNY